MLIDDCTEKVIEFSGTLVGFDDYVVERSCLAVSPALATFGKEANLSWKRAFAWEGNMRVGIDVHEICRRPHHSNGFEAKIAISFMSLA